MPGQPRRLQLSQEKAVKRKVKVSHFLCLILVLTAGWMRFYFAVRETFNGNSDYKLEIAKLTAQRDSERLNFTLAREQFSEFRQYVATLMPDTVKEKGMGEQGYAYRNLASVVSRGDAEKVRKILAKTLFERGKQYYNKKAYAKAIRNFKQIIDRYSYTPFVAESYFLLAESHFQQNEIEECTTVIQQMVELFPHHELTGFALIRLGRIYEMQNRNEDAIDIYKTVLRTYPQRDIASQAKASLRSVNQ